jgi:isoleucyl-tRNA synthetase
MYHILQAMTRWLAPILTFTAEEIWVEIPGGQKDSVLIAQWYEGLEPMAESDEFDRSYWSRLVELREQVSRELERLRKDGEIGSSLAAVVRVYLPETRYAELLPMENELRFVFITSEASIHPMSEKPDSAAEGSVDGEAIGIEVQPSSHDKCVRCWHRRPDLGMAPSHPELCGRCVVNVVGKGESRHYA